MVKIFHAGDIHLDSPFSKLKHAERLSARKYQRDLFMRMAEFVRDNKYDIVLISGDLFDIRNVSPEAEECAFTALETMCCPVVISPGNHDPYNVTPFYAKGRYPKNVQVFSKKEVETFTFSELSLRVCGYAFTDSNIREDEPLSDFTPDPFDGATLLCAHGELDIISSRFATLRSSDIERCGFAYAALGHIHIPSFTLRGDTLIGYSGVADCRGFDEEELGGAVSLTLENGKVTSYERVVFGEHRYVIDELDLSALSSEAELTDAVLAHIGSKGYDKNTAMRLILKGNTDLDLSYALPSALLAASELLMYAEAEDNTLPKLDLKLLEKDFTLKGEIYRNLKPQLDSEDRYLRKLAADALKAALLACEGREIK